MLVVFLITVKKILADATQGNRIFLAWDLRQDTVNTGETHTAGA